MTDHDHDHDHDHAHDEGHSHSHDHGHGHDDPFHPQLGGPLDTSQLDPANRSLAEALRLSFAILTVLMLALLLLFAASGLFNVGEGEVAVRTRLGRLLGPTPDSATLIEPGGPYFALPRPIDQVIRIPTSIRVVNVDDAFWVSVRPEDRNKPLDQLSAKSQLQPGEDGSLITGDKNIVHGKWTVNYQVDRDKIEKFIRNVSASPDRLEMLEQADRRVRHAAERAIVHVVATVSSEAFIRGVNLAGEIRAATQAKLDELDSGITVVGITTAQITPPLSVRAEFEGVALAVSSRGTKIEEARKEAERLLNEAAGPAHPALALAIDYYETARRDGNAEAEQKGEAVIAQLLDGTPAAEALAPLKDAEGVDSQRFAAASTDARVGGNLSKLLSDAHSYRRSVAEEVRAEAEQFQKLYEQYRKNPQTYMALRWQGTLADIYNSDVEIWAVPEGDGTDLYFDLNSDPRLQAAREKQQYSRDKEAEEQAKANPQRR